MSNINKDMYICALRKDASEPKSLSEFSKIVNAIIFDKVMFKR